MEEILHQLIGSLSHYLQGFIHTRRCRISSINSMFSHGCHNFWDCILSLKDRRMSGILKGLLQNRRQSWPGRIAGIVAGGLVADLTDSDGVWLGFYGFFSLGSFEWRFTKRESSELPCILEWHSLIWCIELYMSEWCLESFDIFSSGCRLLCEVWWGLADFSTWYNSSVQLPGTRFTGWHDLHLCCRAAKQGIFENTQIHPNFIKVPSSQQ